ncbi:MAG: DUF4147 domain-containing protein [Bacteroidetes bacterium]|jgi:glycerate-2-kinase|nr:DUF4147 domain-containing protein [Bacteroidota bacterium]
MSYKKEAVQIFKETLKSVNPRELLPDLITINETEKSVDISGTKAELPQDRKLYVIGTGKASPSMANAIEDVFGDRIEEGLIIAPPDSEDNLSYIRMLIGSHPIPDSKSVNATEELLQFIGRIPDGSLVVNLISGGTSALLCAPAKRLTIEQMQQVFNLLIESGADIHEINTVRKSLSRVKGGRLLSYFNDIQLIDLVISDVPNDELKSIGSGPTIPQRVSYRASNEVLHKYDIWNRLPAAAKETINRGVKLEEEENRPFSTTDIRNHDVHIVSSASKVAEQTKEFLEGKGYQTKLYHPAWSGDIDHYVQHLADSLKEVLSNNMQSKKSLLFYGECTVNVTGNGLGGRNQELALRMAEKLEGLEHQVTFLSAGTDGIDGPTDAAGAVVNQDTIREAKEMGIRPEEYIQENDSYHFFEKAGGHIKTGPTGNNVMDQQFFLIH